MRRRKGNKNGNVFNVGFMRNYLVINLLLLIVIGLLGYRFYEVWTKTVEITIQPAEEAVKKGGEERVKRKTETAQGLNEPDYNIIIQKDLFRPTRSIPSPVVKNNIELTPPPRLYGTIITDDEKGAILKDSNTKAKRLYHINDSIAGFTILNIQEDKVVLSREGRTIEVKLREIKTIASPEKPATLSPIFQPPQRRNIHRPIPQGPPSAPPPPLTPRQSDEEGIEKGEDDKKEPHE